MKANVGSLDKIIRIILALIIFVIGYMTKSWWGLLGLIPLVTALTGHCLIYTILGINTCKVKPQPKA